jgi:hypothetical protein
MNGYLYTLKSLILIMVFSGMGLGIFLTESPACQRVSGYDRQAVARGEWRVLVDSEADSCVWDDEVGLQSLMDEFVALAALSPDDIWVNLSPFEPNRILSPALSNHPLGEILIQQDMALKQTAAKVVHPDHRFGRVFWQEWLADGGEMTMGNKVWIVPAQAQVNERSQVRWINSAPLTVLSDEQYVLGEHRTGSVNSRLRQALITELAEIVNSQSDFFPVRRLLRSLIVIRLIEEDIASTLREPLFEFRGGSFSSRVHSLYEQYLDLYQQGSFSVVFERYDPVTQVIRSHKLQSGGLRLDRPAWEATPDAHDLQLHQPHWLVMTDQEPVAAMFEELFNTTRMQDWQQTYESLIQIQRLLMALLDSSPDVRRTTQNIFSRFIKNQYLSRPMLDVLPWRDELSRLEQQPDINPYAWFAVVLTLHDRDLLTLTEGDWARMSDYLNQRLASVSGQLRMQTLDLSEQLLARYPPARNWMSALLNREDVLDDIIQTYLFKHIPSPDQLHHPHVFGRLLRSDMIQHDRVNTVLKRYQLISRLFENIVFSTRIQDLEPLLQAWQAFSVWLPETDQQFYRSLLLRRFIIQSVIGINQPHPWDFALGRLITDGYITREDVREAVQEIKDLDGKANTAEIQRVKQALWPNEFGQPVPSSPSGLFIGYLADMIASDPSAFAGSRSIFKNDYYDNDHLIDDLALSEDVLFYPAELKDAITTVLAKTHDGQPDIFLSNPTRFLNYLSDNYHGLTLTPVLNYVADMRTQSVSARQILDQSNGHQEWFLWILAVVWDLNEEWPTAARSVQTQLMAELMYQALIADLRPSDALPVNDMTRTYMEYAVTKLPTIDARRVFQHLSVSLLDAYQDSEVSEQDLYDLFNRLMQTLYQKPISPIFVHDVMRMQRPGRDKLLAFMRIIDFLLLNRAHQFHILKSQFVLPIIDYELERNILTPRTVFSPQLPALVKHPYNTYWRLQEWVKSGVPIGHRLITFTESSRTESNKMDFLHHLLGHTIVPLHERPSDWPAGHANYHVLRAERDADALRVGSETIHKDAILNGRWDGRTLSVVLNDAVYIFKFLKKGESQAELNNEHLKDTAIARHLQASLDLPGSYPEPVAGVTEVAVADVLPWFSETLHFDQHKALLSVDFKQQAQSFNREQFYHFILAKMDLRKVEDEAMALDFSATPRHVYLVDPRLSLPEFAEAYRINVEAVFKLAAAGIFDTEPMEMFHNEQDRRGYDPLRSLRRSSQEEGRHHAVNQIRYPNYRVTGPADTGGWMFASSIQSNMRLMQANDHRIAMAVDEWGGGRFMNAYPYILAQLLSTEMYALGLMPALYLQNKGLLDYREFVRVLNKPDSYDPEHPAWFLRDRLRELFVESYRFMHPGARGDVDFEPIPLHLERVAKEMAYYLNPQYYPTDIVKKKVPREQLFPEIPVENVIYGYGPDALTNPRNSLTENGWGWFVEQTTISDRGVILNDREFVHNIGGWNGMNYLINFLRAITITAATHVSGALHEPSADTLDTSTSVSPVGGIDLEDIRWTTDSSDGTLPVNVLRLPRQPSIHVIEPVSDIFLGSTE